MIADILFSWCIVIAIAAVTWSVQFIPGMRGIPRRRIEGLVKRLSAGHSPQADEAGDDWGYRMQSFGDIAWAFADAMNRERAAQGRVKPIRASRRGSRTILAKAGA